MSLSELDMCICVSLAASVLGCVWDGRHIGNSSCKRGTEELHPQRGLTKTVSTKRTMNPKADILRRERGTAS